MELNEPAKRAARELGDAINAAIGESSRVAAAIESLRELGYEPNLTLKLEIGLYEMMTSDGDDARENILDETELELTDEDIKTLQKMKIRLE